MPAPKHDAVAAAIDRHRTRPGALLPLLHDVQHALGYVPADRVGEIAAALNLSRAEVHGVITFYHHFRQTPPARHLVQVCQAEACRSMGALDLTDHARARLGCAMHGRSDDGRYGLEPAYCFGMCASSPAIMIDDTLHARVGAAQFDRLIDALDPAPPANAK